MKREDSILLKRQLPIIASVDRLAKRPRPTAQNPIMISASEIKDFLRCRVKWAWRYGLELVPISKAIQLVIGGVGHGLLAQWYALPVEKRTVRRMERICEHSLAKTNPAELSIEDVELIRAMMIGYAYWAIPEDKEIGIGDAKTEIWFEEPLTDDRTIIVRGFIDAAFKVGSMRRTMGAFEHKLKSTTAINAIDLNLQLSVYLWALRRMYPKNREYVAYMNVLRKQMPGPRVKAALFAREPITRTAGEVDQWAMDTQRVCLDMLDAAIYPNPQDDCSWSCDYQSPCLMRGNPDDVAHVLTTHYQKKERRSFAHD